MGALLGSTKYRKSKQDTLRIAAVVRACNASMLSHHAPLCYHHKAANSSTFCKLLGTRQQHPVPLSTSTRPFSRLFFCSTGRLLCHWDPTWPWAQVQLVAACHGPGNTILVLTAARVVFLVAHSGDKQQRGSAAGVEPVSSSEDGDPQQAQPFAQQQVLKSYSVKVGGGLQKVALLCCAQLQASTPCRLNTHGRTAAAPRV